MKKSLLLCLLLVTQYILAQFTADDVKYFIGNGDQVAYVVVDFKDGTDDRSYAWGVKYNAGEAPKIFNLLQKIQAEEPAFSFQGTSFLNAITFNAHHAESGSDWWSTWTGNSATSFTMNGGMSGAVNNGKWYGFSYGFTNPAAQPPISPIPAYSSQWYSASAITNWIGNGTHQSVIVIDFGTDTNGIADSFSFGIRYNGTITAQQALQLIANQNANFNFTINNDILTQVTLNNYSANNSLNNVWKNYVGTNLSNWKTQTDLAQVNLSNNTWLGFSFTARRPFTPHESTSSHLSINSTEFSNSEIRIFPNPTTDYLYIKSSQKIVVATIYSLSGQKILESKNKSINLTHIPKGTYILDLITNQEKKSFKIIKN